MNIGNWHPFNKKQSPAPETPAPSAPVNKQKEAIKKVIGDHEPYSDEASFNLLKEFGTVDLHKIEAIIAERVKSGEYTEVPQEEEPLN